MVRWQLIDQTLVFEHLLVYLKHESVGSQRDCIKVVEYQRGGLPQAHIALAIENPPGTAQEVNNIVPGELPAEASTLRMVATTNVTFRILRRI